MRSACLSSHDISEEGAEKGSVVVGQIGKVNGPGTGAVRSGRDLCYLRVSKKTHQGLVQPLVITLFFRL